MTVALRPDWKITTAWSWHRRQVIAHTTELSITGESGRFVFQRYVRTAAGREWIDVYGGKTNHETIRSFHPRRIKTVHRTTRTRARG